MAESQLGESTASSSEDAAAAAAAAVGATAAGWYQIHFIEQNTTGIAFNQFYCTSTFFPFTIVAPMHDPVLTKRILKSVKSFFTKP